MIILRIVYWQLVVSHPPGCADHIYIMIMVNNVSIVYHLEYICYLKGFDGICFACGKFRELCSSLAE
jgi:hypothetical protein